VRFPSLTSPRVNAAPFAPKATASAFWTERALIRPRIFLADDHREFLEAEADLLSSRFELVGTANDGISLVSEVLRLNPDVVVVDITMPRMSGIEAVHNLVGSGCTAKFVFLTVNTNEEFVKACQEAGAQGYVWKSQIKAHLIPAIHAVLQNCRYVSPLTSS
jgi:DNA-binding NarL/FixJ family response regulator